MDGPLCLFTIYHLLFTVNSMEQSSAQNEVEVRDCATFEEFDRCIELQREAFALPDLEVTPRRHLIVTRRAGGWTLGAFSGGEMVGFVHHMVAVTDVCE